MVERLGGTPMRWIAALVVTGLVACSPAAAPQGGTTASGAPAASAAPVVGGTMTMRIFDDWGTLDILTQLPRQTALHVDMALYDRLVAVAPDGKIIPYLAESWKEAPDQIDFTLKSGVTCSDGTALTATAVADWLKKWTTANSASAVRNFRAGPYTITANDSARTVTFKMAQPFSDAIWGFTSNQMGVICPKGVADPKLLEAQSFGSGPFTIESAQLGDQLVLKARPDWKWGPFGVTGSTPGFPDKLIFKVITNETTAANLLTTGGLDLARIESPSDVKRLLDTNSYQVKKVSSFYAYAMVMNESPERPTADEKVREAVMTAVNRDEYGIAGYGGLSKVATSLFAPDWECYEPAVQTLLPQPGPDKARAVLTAAGWTAGPNGKLQKNGKPLTINLLSRAEGAPEYLAEQFDKAGITVKYDAVDPNTNSVRVRGGQYDVAVQRAGGTDYNPSGSITLFSGPLPPTGTNYSYIIDPTLDGLVSKAQSVVGAARCTGWKDVQRRLLERHHILPLAYPTFYQFARGIDYVAWTFIEPGSLKRLAK